MSKNNPHEDLAGSRAVSANDDRDLTTVKKTKPSWKDDLLGDRRSGDVKNISWGAVIAGVVTFLALMILLSLVTAALGLGNLNLTSSNPGEGVGFATGVWSVIALALSLAAGGFVAGLLAGRAGLVHGFLTWATSLLTAVVLASMLVGNILGVAGGALGSLASTTSDAAAQNPGVVASMAPTVSASEASQAAEDAQQKASQTAEDAAPEAEQAADTAASGAIWSFIGLLIGAAIASLAGLFGSRSVARTGETETQQRRIR